ncbi:hypothetical protein ACEV8D_22805 [Vibrio parahaemolyticus]
MTSKYFNPHKSFISLPALWGVVVALSLFSLVLAFIIVANSELDVDLSFTGFNNFLTVFRVPLGILALIIPIVALLAANHRSEQTKEQIRVTNQQNNFANYYKHIEEYEKYAMTIADYEEISRRNIRRNHKLLFSRAIDGDYSVSTELLETIKLLAVDIDAKEMAKSELHERYLAISNEFRLDDTDVESSEYDVDEVYENFHKLVYKIDYLMSFSDTYSTPDELSVHLVKKDSA